MDVSNNAQSNYAVGYDPDILRFFRGRSVEVQAAYLIRHLKAGMRVLDAGSGQGSISLGLAKIVGPTGDVTGIDVEPSQVDDARIAARELGVTNIRFQHADVTRLPFPDSTYDAVHMYSTMCHVPDRKTAMRELFRVIKPGGLIGTSDPVFSRATCIPEGSLSVERMRLCGKAMDACGGDGDFGLHSAQALHDAGFVRLLISMVSDPVAELPSEQLSLMADRLPHERFIEVALQKGLIGPERILQVQEALREASRKPFYYLGIPHVNLVGWKP